jgi:hypothetical protein
MIGHCNVTCSRHFTQHESIPPFKQMHPPPPCPPYPRPPQLRLPGFLYGQYLSAACWAFTNAGFRCSRGCCMLKYTPSIPPAPPPPPRPLPTSRHEALGARLPALQL